MKKVFLGLICSLFLASFGLGQSDEYHKAEFFAGYSINRIDFGVSGDPDLDNALNEGRNFQGFNASVTGNVNKYVGLKFDVSGHYKNYNVNIPGFTNQPQIKASLYNFLGGVQIKNNSKTRRVKPFVHALAGIGTVKTSLNNAFCQEALGTNCPAEFRERESAFAMAFGG